MNVSLYQAAAAMNAQSRWQELITENLAAGTTPGFCKRNVSFADVAAASPMAMNGANPANFMIPVAVTSTSFQQGQLRATGGALDFAVEFAAGESIHTENSYKYRPGQAEALLKETGFRAEATWTDPRGWFAVCLGRASSP